MRLGRKNKESASCCWAAWWKAAAEFIQHYTKGGKVCLDCRKSRSQGLVGNMCHRLDSGLLLWPTVEKLFFF